MTPSRPAATRAGEKRGRARERTAYNGEREAGVDPVALAAAMAARAELDVPPRARRAGPRAAPSTDVGRWVPIGPSVVRRGQAVDRPHVVGRIRDLAVSADGRRAYAASAKGGLWYTEDGAATWAPVGAWIGGGRRTGGNTNVLVCGAVLVDFGATQSTDFVMVGTGELSPFSTASGSGRVGGVGVLAARGPVFSIDTMDPWEIDTGLAQLEGLGIYRLVRRPGRTAGETTPATRDEVLAATSGGLFLGTRAALPATPANPPMLAAGPRDGFRWTRLAGIPAGTRVTDVVWVTRVGGTRIVALVDGAGVRVSDDDGATFVPVPTLHRPAVAVTGRLSIDIATGNRAYVLCDVGGVPSIYRIPDLTATPPVATALTAGVPAVWTSAGSRDYDQAIAVEEVGGTDRVYLGGNAVRPAPGMDFGASLWAFDVAGTTLAPRVGVSTTGPPPGVGADQPGLVGNNVHADVHAICLPGAPAGTRQVWVACDGGVYVSHASGQVNTFAAAGTGLAVLEAGYLASHPASTHYLAVGCQDNGTSVRVGDSVWEEVHVGDGGGVAILPTAPHVVAAQYIYGFWRSTEPTFRDPLTRGAGGPTGAISAHPEYSSARAQFYAGCATVAVPASGATPAHSRLAIGTDQVWLTDTLGTGVPTTWRVVPLTASGAPPATTSPAADPFPAVSNAGAPPPAFGQIVALVWLTPTVLVAAYQNGVLRHTEVAAGSWHTDYLVDPAGPVVPPSGASFTDVTAVPGRPTDVYLTTLGATGVAAPDTLYYFDGTAGTFHPTGLRHQLDAAVPPLGPLDPAYAVVVDPAAPTHVYVGTATGVWHGVRADLVGTHAWSTFVNGLPEATVQDLDIWHDPAEPTRLLRAAVQARGVWETDLAAPTPVMTYLRAHQFDDRRRAITPGAHPQRAGGAPPLTALASPDVVVRPSWPAAAAPAFPQVTPLVPDDPLTSLTASAFDTWTFQTAFRWWYPSVRADGQWPDSFSDLVEFDRRVRGMPAGRTITRALWDAVVGGTRLATAPDGTVSRSAAPGDPLAVWRAPWQTGLAPDLPASEVDVMECVVPRTSFGGVWGVRAGPATVEVLIHHRSSSTTIPTSAYAALLWARVSVGSNPLGFPAAPIRDYWRDVSAVGAGTVAAPTGWTVVPTAGGAPLHGLGVGVDARIPRAVSIDLDLTGQAGRVIALVALVGSAADGGIQPPSGSPTTLSALLLRWPHIALRLIRVS